MTSGHEDYADEHRAASSEPVLVRVSDLPPLTERERMVIECAYRRGFFQGWFGCFSAIHRGFSLRKVESFLYKQLYKWRYCKHDGKMTPPPEMPGRAIRKEVK